MGAAERHFLPAREHHGTALCINKSKLVSAPVDSYRYHLISERDVVEMEARRDKESKESGIW